MRKRASITRAIFRWLLLLTAAFVGGIVATAAYHFAVERPRATAGPRVEARPAPRLAPPMQSSEMEQAIDPLQQALAVARRQLYSGALLEVSVRREGEVAYLTGTADSHRTVARAAQALGRIAGVKAVDTRGVTLAGREHVIEAGDNPSKISRRYYGNKCGWKRIEEANPNLDPKTLRVGKKLVIPAVK